MAGYYSNVSDALSQAYNSGVDAGKSQATTTPITVINNSNYKVVTPDTVSTVTARDLYTYTFQESGTAIIGCNAGCTWTNSWNSNGFTVAMLHNTTTLATEGASYPTDRMNDANYEYTQAYASIRKTITYKKGDTLTIKATRVSGSQSNLKVNIAITCIY